MQEAVEKEFIKMFNNMCRKDNNIYSWCVFKTYEGLQIDILFSNHYNSETYDLHRIIHPLELKSIRNSVMYDYCKMLYNEFTSSYHNHNTIRFKNEKDI